jgi:transcriptional regulator with XRE-family HTH domain
MKAVPATRSDAVSPTGRQLRAARALGGLSAKELADLSGVSLNTIKRAEASDGPCSIMPANLAAIIRTLLDHGIVLFGRDEHGGEGVRTA